MTSYGTGSRLNNPGHLNRTGHSSNAEHWGSPWLSDKIRQWPGGASHRIVELLRPVDSAGQSVADNPRWPVSSSVPLNPISVSPGSAERDFVQRQVIKFIHACQTVSYLNTIDTGLSRRADYAASGNPFPEANSIWALQHFVQCSRQPILSSPLELRI